MSRSFNEQGAQRLFFTLVPLPQDHCSSCGCDPRQIYDEHNQFVKSWDKTQAIEHKGQLCLTCALSSAAFIAPYLGSSWGRP